MSTKIIGLDIGTTSIRAAYLKRDGQKVVLDSIASVPQTSKGLLSDSIVDAQILSDALKQLFSNANIKIRNVVLSIPDNLTYTKIIEMPQLSEQELTAALKFEMEQYIPLPIDQVKTDWEILGTNDGEGRKTMNVMIVAAPITLLQKYEKILEMAGFIPEAIETEIVSVHRALLPLVNTQDSNMILHIGAMNTSIAIVKDGKIKMVFTIGLGGHAMTRAISIDLGIDLVQAESYKKAYGLNPSAFEGKIVKILNPVVGAVLADIKKAILLFRERNPNNNIKQIILSGGSALLPGLDVYLTNALSTQVVVGSSLNAYGITNIPAEIQSQGPSYNVVVGLALRNIL